MKKITKFFTNHALVIIGFILFSLVYFYPVLGGKQIYQSDIVQYTGMARQINEYRSNHKKEIYWTDSSFGGMPTYQLGVNYPYNYVKKIDKFLRFLPRPADYLFLYLLCFYILGLVLTSDFKISLIGALAFGLSTYFLIIISVGHNSKAHAIAYMPLVLAGILLVFQKRYFIGFLLSTLALALEIGANHFQMTYYLMFAIIILGICYLINSFLKKQLRHFFSSVGILFVALLISIGLNSTNILATKEYVNDTTRGDSELTINSDGSPKEKTKGLSKEYITLWSYGIVETFNLVIPRFMGGENSEKLDENSNSYNTLIELGASPRQALNIVQGNIPTYWGEQPGVAGPAYIGATVIFLSLLALFLIKGKNKWWLISTSILVLLLSYGKNLAALTNFFIDYFPFYNKFRAVSSIQVIVELCIPIIAMLGLAKLFKTSSYENAIKLKKLKYVLIITTGVVIFLFVFRNLLFDFTSERDLMNKEIFGPNLMDSIIEDRKSLFNIDIMRTLILMILCSVVIWSYLKKNTSKKVTIALIGLLIILDLVPVNRRYLNEENFVSSIQIKKPFVKSSADIEILKDKSHFRVYDLSSPFFSGRSSFFHNSIGGYHAAQPKRIQDLYDFYISKNNIEILNMLNVKYIIEPKEKEGAIVIKNPSANGNAWFVKSIKLVNTPNDEILYLDSIDTKKQAIVRNDIWENYRKAEEGYYDQSYFSGLSFDKDKEASIELIDNTPGYLKYSSNNNKVGFALFSENFYMPGWQAYMDGKKVSHIRVNYALRGVIVPPGKHNIEFKFSPEVISTGSNITLISFFVFIICILVLSYYKFKNIFSKRHAQALEN
ncbi:YfhO family protein [Aquimarina algiphila]|uniref:YfhO family protein n=1 Tax=Aquimarina algiphila TaxID=2047982 RepID=UPI00232C6B26|nr:YfhO family protein [Aquimarina algiphila]